jgi:hypothetical protein
MCGDIQNRNVYTAKAERNCKECKKQASIPLAFHVEQRKVTAENVSWNNSSVVPPNSRSNGNNSIHYEDYQYQGSMTARFHCYQANSAYYVAGTYLRELVFSVPGSFLLF